MLWILDYQRFYLLVYLKHPELSTGHVKLDKYLNGTQDFRNLSLNNKNSMTFRERDVIYVVV